jgi:hypothetical protein
VRSSSNVSELRIASSAISGAALSLPTAADLRPIDGQATVSPTDLHRDFNHVFQPFPMGEGSFSVHHNKLRFDDLYIMLGKYIFRGFALNF